MPQPAGRIPRASAILRPGLRTLGAGVERHVVRGGGAVTVKLHPGDRVIVTDLEGLQPCELKATGTDGRSDAGILDVPGGETPLRVFGSGRAGERAEFTAQREAFLRVSAPGGVMDADGQDTATDIELVIHRATPVRYKGNDMPLPDPLADVLQDIRVKAATARAFTVKAGDYIQIIDVSGRQMTDFQCFSMR